MTVEEGPAGSSKGPALPSAARRVLTGAWSVVLMGVFVALALGALLGFELWREREEIEAQAFRETRNLAALIDAHVTRTVDSTDEVLQALAARSRTALSGGPPDIPALESDTTLLLPGLAQLGGLMLLDASGRVLVSTVSTLPRGTDLSAMEFYRRAATAGATEAKPYIGALTQDRQSGRWYVPMSRGVYDMSGRLLGVAAATINPEALVSLFDVFDIDRFSAVTLTQPDGVIVARSPEQDRFVGRTLAGGELDRRLAPQAPSGSARIRGILFGRDLFISYRTVANAPFVINVAFDANRVMLPWVGLARLYVMLGLALLAAIAVCVWLVRRDQFRRTALAASQQVHDIIEGMTTHVALLERDGTLIEVNRALLHTGRRSRADVIGKRLWDTFWYSYSPDSRNRIRDAIDLAAAGEIVRSDFTLRSADASFAAVDTTFRPLYESGTKTTRIIVSGVDVTERRKLEQQLAQSQKMEAIGLLASGIAHDFNNMLAIIANFAQFLVDDLKDHPVQQSHAVRIVKACERGKQVVQQLTAYARPASAARASTDLRAVLAEVETLVRPALHATAVLQMDLGVAPVNVVANEAQLTQIFVNLCVNARDALEGKPGFVRVGLSVARPSDPAHPAYPPATQTDPATTACRTGIADSAKAYALVTVADTGIGMDAAALKRIFEPFYTTKPRGQGTGLGLAIVDGIIQSLGGVGCVESRPGNGTRFSIYLPVEELSARPQNASAASRRPSGKLRVLVVDDDLAVAETVAAMIGRLNHEATIFGDPLEACAAFSENPDYWDVVITDEQMPKMTGCKLIAELKRLRPHIPMILSTGLASLSDAEARAHGADALLAKPIDSARLAVALRTAVRAESLSGAK